MADIKTGEFPFTPGADRPYPEYRPAPHGTRYVGPLRDTVERLTTDIPEERAYVPWPFRAIANPPVIREGYEAPRSQAKMGFHTVTDPEGRTGTPMFVAGSSADGTNKPLSPGEVSTLAGLLANSSVEPPEKMYDAFTNSHLDGAFAKPGGKIGPEGYRGILRVSEEPSLPAYGIQAHEVGHAVHAGMNPNPDSGIAPFSDGYGEPSRFDPLFKSGMTNEWRRDSADSVVGQDGAHWYYHSPEELFAESFRAYVQDPAGFKAQFPEEAARMRELVNESWLKDYLMLSEGPKGLSDTMGVASMVG